MGFVKGLRCKECGKNFEKLPIHVCEYCFGPLEVDYDYTAIGKVVSRKSIQDGPPSMWRYKEFMPIDEAPKVGLHTGFTPLVRAKNLGKALGLKELYIKNDSVNHPTFSFKDRVVAVAVSKAMEFGFDTISCASTGNLAKSGRLRSGPLFGRALRRPPPLCFHSIRSGSTTLRRRLSGDGAGKTDHGARLSAFCSGPCCRLPGVW